MKCFVEMKGGKCHFGQRLQRSVLSSILSIVYRHVFDRSKLHKTDDTAVDR